MIEIRLTQGKVALIDDCDSELASLRWYAAKRGNAFYAVRHKPRELGHGIVYLHRLVLGATAGLEVDHINGDGLDCRRTNLRLATPSENRRNQRRANASGFKGVHWNPSNRGWVASIKVHKKVHHLGTFSDAAEAARAYDAAAIRLHGEFARLNFHGPLGLWTGAA